jgi:hypothetical protein
MGVISSRKRLIWSLHLKKHLREKFDLTLLLPEIDIYPGLAYDRLRPGISAPYVIPFANNYTPPASYAKRFLTRLPVLCLPGLGPVTERHLQALSSGRLAIMDDSISKLKIPMLELKSGSNCLIASTRNEMVQFVKDVMHDPSTALKIAKTGMEMFKDCYSPEIWFLNNLDRLSGV